MKNWVVFMFTLVIVSACSNERLLRSEAVTKYYNGFDTGNFNEIKSVLGDSITLSSGDYVMPYGHSDFYEFFKWDSVFDTSFKIIDLIEKGNQIEVKIKSESDRYRYLENNPLETKFLISFDEERITSIKDLGSETADWVIWRTKVDTLVNWTKVHHPELDGFIFDISMKGAQNYREAIRHFERGPNVK